MTSLGFSTLPWTSERTERLSKGKRQECELTENRMGRAFRTTIIVLQSVFGVALILLSAQLHFNRHYSPYDIVLVILCIIVTTRLTVVIIVATNCVYRFAEKLHELRNFLEKCNGRTEYEHLALKLKVAGKWEKNNTQMFNFRTSYCVSTFFVRMYPAFCY